MSGAVIELATRQVPRNWHITAIGPVEPVAGAPSRQVALDAGAAMLMNFDDRAAANEIAELLRWYRGNGCIRLLRKHRDMLLLEWLSSPSLADLLLQRREDEAIGHLCQVVATLHRRRRSLPKVELTSLREHMQPLLAQRFSADPLMRHGARLASALMSSGDHSQPLHGALRLDNIHRHDQRGWLAGLPMGLIGDIHYEFAPALAHSCAGRDILSASRCIRDQAGKIAARNGLDRDRLLTFAFCHSAQSLLTAEHHGQSTLIWRDRTLTLLDSLVE